MGRRDEDVKRERDEIERTEEAGDYAPADELRPVDAGQQDYGSRNVIMSNALQGGASPAAGAVIGTGGELGMQPETDEELAGDEHGLPPHERR